MLSVPVDEDPHPWTYRHPLTDWLPYVHGWLECYDAVRAGVGLFRRLLGYADARGRVKSAYALSWFPEHADGSISALADAVEVEPVPTVAATILIAIGLLADPADGESRRLRPTAPSASASRLLEPRCRPRG